MKETIIKIEGMICNGCENRVQNALKTMEGIEEVVANHIKGTVIITSKNEVEKSAIIEKIKDLGFEIKED